MRLFHFSEDDSIELFEPRPVRVPSCRAPGMEWLNGSLVWAIDDWHQPMYLFPRDCPRILMWPKQGTTGRDIEKYMGATPADMIAYIERDWLHALQTHRLYRYELPSQPFVPLHDAGMWVAKSAVEPLAKDSVEALPARLAEHGVQLRVLDTLTPLRDAWCSTLHVSGIRLRNAKQWARQWAPNVGTGE
jgi:hypothetical protein